MLLPAQGFHMPCPVPRTAHKAVAVGMSQRPTSGEPADDPCAIAMHRGWARAARAGAPLSTHPPPPSPQNTPPIPSGGRAAMRGKPRQTEKKRSCTTRCRAPGGGLEWGGGVMHRGCGTAPSKHRESARLGGPRHDLNQPDGVGGNRCVSARLSAISRVSMLPPVLCRARPHCGQRVTR